MRESLAGIIAEIGKELQNLQELRSEVHKIRAEKDSVRPILEDELAQPDLT